MKTKTKSEAELHFRRFEEMLKHIVSVPKSEIDRRESEWKKERTRKKSLKKAHVR